MSCWRSWRRQRSLATCSPSSRSVSRLSRNLCLLMMARSLAWFLLKVSTSASPAASHCCECLPCCTLSTYCCAAGCRHNTLNTPHYNCWIVPGLFCCRDHSRSVCLQFSPREQLTCFATTSVSTYMFSVCSLRREARLDRGSRPQPDRRG